jgi:DNA-binding winged helix-turn-helix (wHTH) protein
VPRYRFSEFILSPRRRMLIRNGCEQPLIPRYFDLLVFLIERRSEAVHRRDIFDRIWSDVVVSDSALSQAIRTIRRVLGDDSREPRFVRTVSRHGYRFVFADVVEEDDEGDWQDAETTRSALGTSEALHRLGARPRHTFARALLRDTRWDVARTGASIGGGLAGLVGGTAGGLILTVSPGSSASLAVVPVLALLGCCCGAAGGAGVGAGLSVAESIARSRRAIALLCGAALGGGLAGFAAEWLGRWSLAALVGVNIDIGGGVEGLAIGGAAGLGYSVATAHSEGGLAAPRGHGRLAVASVIAAACGFAALALAFTGRPLVGGTIHVIAEASAGSQATLTPLGRLIGEPDFGPLTSAVIATGEGALFGLGLALGLTRRSSVCQ